MTRKDGVVTVNGRVHAICNAMKKPVVYQVFPDHFERCLHCQVYTELETWEDAQASALFTTGLEAPVVCGVSCGRCKGYSGRLFHSQGSRIPRKPVHSGWPDSWGT